MLNINETESKNVVSICGTLSELEVEQKRTGDGREYVAARGSIKVDQEIDGVMYENTIPFRQFSMKLKKDGTTNKIYDSIVKEKETLTSLAACPEDQPNLASRVRINGRLEENIWIDQSTKTPRTSFQISTSFLNSLRGEQDDEATFELSGIVINMSRETDMNGDETGRLKLKFAVVRYGGRVDVIDLIAQSPNAVNFIESNWNEGDTVNVNGVVNVSQHTKVWYEEQGFGPAIKRTKSESRKELIILGGSPSGLEEAYCYDPDAVKAGLAGRQARTEELKQRTSAPKKTSKVNDFGF